MLHNDGKYKIYTIVFRSENYRGGDWCELSMDGQRVANIPKELRRDSDKDWKALQPLYSFTACGKCWQRTGIMGTFKRKRAVKMLSLLRKYNPDMELAIRKTFITQKSSVTEKCKTKAKSKTRTETINNV